MALTVSRAAVAALLCGLVLAVPASARGAGPATEFSDGISDAGFPAGIAAGPDGNLWFTEFNGHRIGRITPDGTVAGFSAGITTGAAPFGIEAGPDGNLWFTELGGNRIGRITPDGTVTEFSAGITANAAPSDIAAGSDGNLWFTEYSGNRIGRITPTGTVTEFSAGITAGAGLEGIAAGPDGNLWFTEFDGSRIGRITPGGTVTEFSAGITTSSGPRGIAPGPDGNLWFTEYSGNRIGRITPDGTVTEFSAGVTAGAGPFGIAAGPDGNLWFTEFNGNRIGRITPDGAVTEFSAGITAGAHPLGIAAGPEGNLWFTEHDGNRVGRIDTDVAAPVAGNLLRNPGFELGAPGSARLLTVPVPGWVAIPNFTVGLYGGGNLPPTALSDEIGGGQGFAFGGPNADGETHALQLVDIARESAAIDDGRAQVTLAGLLGGQGGQQDQAAVSALFLTASGTVLASVQIGPVSEADRDGQTTLLARSATAMLPADTRAIRVVPTATNIGGGSNNGYFDNLSLTLDITPLPGEGPPGGEDPGGEGPGGDGPPDTVAPVFLFAGLTRTSFAAGRGTAFLYTLSETSAVRFAIERRRRGRRVGQKCVKPSKGNRANKRCARYVKRVTLTQDGAAGANRRRFSGRIGGRDLKRGRYRATLTAIDPAGNTSRRKRLSFKIVKPR